MLMFLTIALPTPNIGLAHLFLGHPICCYLNMFSVQLTHAIKITDLKPEYRWIDGRRRIKNYCSLIESRTQASIQLHWRLALVKFHIAGLEDDVVRAVLLIREEFEVQCII